MSRMIHEFYVQPMNQVYIETIAIYVVWTIGTILIRGKARKVIAVSGVILSVGLIILYTIHGRFGGNNRALSLTPFITFINAKIEPELYRTMFMNMLLFIPLGLSLPFVLSRKIKHCVLAAIILGFLMSAGIELIQFFFHLGRCETDDVIMNTLGVMIGTTSYLVCRIIDRLRNQS